MTSQLRHHYVVSCKCWWDILQFFSHTDCQDDSRQKLWKVVQICQSYGQNIVGPFFRTRCSIISKPVCCRCRCCLQHAEVCWSPEVTWPSSSPTPSTATRTTTTASTAAGCCRPRTNVIAPASASRPLRSRPKPSVGQSTWCQLPEITKTDLGVLTP